jgi:fatty acid desaturase
VRVLFAVVMPPYQIFLREPFGSVADLKGRKLRTSSPGQDAISEALGAVPVARFLFHYFLGDGSGMIQSLIIGAVLMLVGAISAMFALLADLVAYNRQLLELTLERVRKIEYIIDAKEERAKKRFPIEQIRKELSSLKAAKRQ